MYTRESKTILAKAVAYQLTDEIVLVDLTTIDLGRKRTWLSALQESVHHISTGVFSCPELSQVHGQHMH